MFEVKELDVFHNKLQALWGINLKVEKGEFVSIIGSNGAGKTTLLRAISGILPVASGSIEFMGKRIDRLASHAVCNMGLIHVPEGRKLFPLTTVKENLQMGASSMQARKQMNASYEDIFQLFPVLKERQNQLAGTLSGGQQQMLAIGRGLMSLPKLLMLDEPTLGLAPKAASEVLDCLSSLNKRGMTILLVSQEVAHSLKLADRGYIFDNGRVALSGMGKELLENENVRSSYLGM